MSEPTADDVSRPRRNPPASGDEPVRREPPLAAAARRLAAERAAAAAAAGPRARQRPTSPPAATPPPAPPAQRASAPPALPPPQVSAAPRPPVAPPAYTNYAPPTGPPAAAPVPQVATDPVYSAWWKRVCAALIDAVVVSIPNGIIFAVIGGSVVETDPTTGVARFNVNGAYVASLLITFALTLVYFVVMEGGPRAASVGKMAMNITVRDASDLAPIGYARALGRRVLATVVWYLFFLPGILDVLWPLWDDRHQTLHDKAVRSVVVDKA